LVGINSDDTKASPFDSREPFARSRQGPALSEA
jgi:hypothetical protein